MAPSSSTATALNDTDALLHSFVRGERARALRVQLAARHPEASADEIEDAIQYACKSFLDEAEEVTAPGRVYSWIRTAASRSLNREAERQHRELAIDPADEEELEKIADEDADPAEELISHEDDADLEGLVRQVSSSLPDRRRDVLALYGAGYKRPQIADRLGLTERTVKRDLLAIMDRARAIVAGLAGGGCDRGEPLVLRHACGISTPDESMQAREHLAQCARCHLFSEKLAAWREKTGAMLPAPVAEGASPGVLERLAQKSVEGLSALKQQVLDGGAQLKQHAATSYYRAVDPTPLAAARPGTVATVVAGCIALGGGTTYCVEQGVDPLGAAKGLIAAEPESEPTSTAPPESSEPPAPVYTPVEPVEEEPQPAPEPAPTEVEEQPKPEPPPPPPVEDSFEPVAPAYQSSKSEAEAPSREPAPAPAKAGPQFGGP